MLDIFFILSNNAKSIYNKTISSIDYKIDEFHNSTISKIKTFQKNYHNGSINIDEFLAFDKDIESIIVLDKTGKILKSVLKHKTRDIFSLNSLKNDIYKNFIKTGKNCFEKVKFYNKDNYAVISYIFKFKDKIFIFGINTLDIKSFVQHLTKDIPYIRIVIADKRGNYILNTCKVISTNKSFFDTIVYKKGIKNKPELKYREYYNKKRGHDDIVTYKINKKTGWYIVTIDIVDHIDDILYTIAWLIVFIIVTTFLVFMGANKFTTSITKPLEALTSKMREFSTSKDSKKIDIKSKYAIFNNMIESFNAMQKKIIQKQNELEKLNATLEKRVNEEVKKNEEAQLKLMQQARLAQMGEMISMIAHQWRQPLTAINSTALKINLQAKLKKLTMQTAQESSLKISQYSQHLSNTIDDFRNFYKPNKEKTLVDIEEIVSNVLYITDTSIKEKKIELIKDIECHEKFLSYANEIKQVILNLIKNAVEALEENNIVNPKIYIKSYQKDNKCILEISDNAGGIPTEIVDKIFDPYFSTKEEKNGTGLGLYMSKVIIEDHCNGTISAENNKIGGATFKIEFTYTIS